MGVRREGQEAEATLGRKAQDPQVYHTKLRKGGRSRHVGKGQLSSGLGVLLVHALHRPA